MIVILMHMFHEYLMNQVVPTLLPIWSDISESVWIQTICLKRGLNLDWVVWIPKIDDHANSL